MPSGAFGGRVPREMKRAISLLELQTIVEPCEKSLVKKTDETNRKFLSLRRSKSLGSIELDASESTNGTVSVQRNFNFAYAEVASRSMLPSLCTLELARISQEKNDFEKHEFEELKRYRCQTETSYSTSLPFPPNSEQTEMRSKSHEQDDDAKSAASALMELFSGQTSTGNFFARSKHISLPPLKKWVIETKPTALSLNHCNHKISKSCIHL